MKTYIYLKFLILLPVLAAPQLVAAAPDPCAKITQQTCGTATTHFRACRGTNSRESAYADCKKKEMENKAPNKDDPNMRGKTSDGPTARRSLEATSSIQLPPKPKPPSTDSNGVGF